MLHALKLRPVVGEENAMNLAPAYSRLSSFLNCESAKNPTDAFLIVQTDRSDQYFRPERVWF